MFDMMKIMGRVKEAQGKIKEVHARLAEMTIEGEAGGGMVRATVNGKRQVLSIDIDPVLLSEKDKEMIQDLSVAAVNNACEKAEELAKVELKKATEGMLPNIPGLDLGGMFGA
ncbi:nucleoid-associated protein [Fulvitalea axinellae]|uniref:Nucleoid-associated protein FUAX_06650 n=1 Tax=Fulvitalea axinellae TaxID=1182444 RepID=A0AAU9CEH8_9BACT|nr:nucleoid-associated protein [Fulvitalea axinellae]